MTNRGSSWKIFGILFFGFFVGGGFYLAQGPDETLVLDRRLRSSLTPERIDRHISAPNRWKQWFYSLSEVIGPPELAKGEFYTLKIDPKKGQTKRFDLQAQVLDYVPGKLLHLKIVSDSSQRLTRLFDSLEWKIEIQPLDQGALLRGISIGHTRHWRSRVFGRIAEKILMNQVFYPNLMQLADLKQPFEVDEAPHMPAGAL